MNAAAKIESALRELPGTPTSRTTGIPVSAVSMFGSIKIVRDVLASPPTT